MESGMVPLALDYLRSRFSTDSLYSSTSSSRGKSEVCSSGSLSSNSAGMSSDSGFMSTSSQSMDSNKDSDSFSRKNLDSSYFEKGLFVGKPEEFLQHGLQAEWSKWDPVRDIRNVLSHSLLDEMRSIFWDKDEEEDNEFEVLKAAYDRDERAVALAVFVAKNHRQLNTANNNRQTLLHIAAEYCSAQLVRLIITRGADGALPDAWGNTPLHIAALHGRASVIKALTTTLTKAEVRHPYFRVPYKSLPQDNVQSYNHDGRTPVHLAAQVSHSPKHRQALEMLKNKARADIDYRRLGDGYAPAHIAIDNDDYECLKTCLELGSDSEVRNYKSETPQQLAYLCKSQEMVLLCQKYGAGKYQLEYAETEPVLKDDDSMEVEEEEQKVQSMEVVSNRMEKMLVT
ncbi:cact [Bugula neritina]|uniref:Cact n=1 Tax=Bugula neritina TaxID=10212 RepID=A0A7J7JBK8_BUGNE|nr:cact [Bugula neritina]